MTPDAEESGVSQPSPETVLGWNGHVALERLRSVLRGMITELPPGRIVLKIKLDHDSWDLVVLPECLVHISQEFAVRYAFL